MAARKVIVTGDRAIDRKLAQLAFAAQGKVVRPAMRRGLGFVREVCMEESPVDTGTMRKAIKIRVPKKKKRGAVEMEVRIEATEQLKKVSGRTGKAVFYPAIVQYGSKDHPPNAFMTRAYQRSGPYARRVTLQGIKEGLDREARS